MKYFSTSNKTQAVDLRMAVLKGMPDDKGLYVPEYIPQFESEFIKNIFNKTFTDISIETAKSFLVPDLSLELVEKIVKESINFDAPLVNIKDNIYTLELFHGPTSAFKDFGARFMSRLMAYFNQGETKKLNILVATSGDTGSAVASGFYNVEGINVYILYPKGKVSHIQEQQLTTLGKNITALEVDGSFDDCQRLVKQAFVDKDVNTELRLSSANSINIARLIPQSFYYTWAYAQLKEHKKVLISVPSGNFGNLTAGLIAKKMGVPIYKFIASTNINAVVPEYLSSGAYQPRPSMQTISNAMDVGTPSNFVRMMDLYSSSLNLIKEDVLGCSYNDEQTRQAIKQIYAETKYIMDPHGAVAYLGLINKMNEDASVQAGVFLETAHPAKFFDVVNPIINSKVNIPHNLEVYLNRKKDVVELSTDYEDFKEFLLYVI